MSTVTIAHLDAWAATINAENLAQLCAAADEHPVAAIAQHAALLLQRLRAPQLAHWATPYIAHPNDTIAHWAVRQVAAARHLPALPALHTRLAATPSLALQRALLRALAYLPDPRNRRAVLPGLRHADPAICCAAIRAYAALVQHRLTRRTGPLRRLLEHANARVRQTALWALPDRRYWWLRRTLRRIACHDVSPTARRGAFRLLVRHWSPGEFLLVCRQAAADPDRMVRLELANAIPYAPRWLQRRGVAALVRNTTAPQLAAAMIQLCATQDSDRAFFTAQALRLWRQTCDAPTRLTLLDTFGQLPDATIWDTLFQRATHDTSGADPEQYAAVRALAQHPYTYHPTTLPRVLERLWDRPLHLQALLKLAQRRQAGAWPAECIERLLTVLDSPVLNNRYLAALLLATQQPASVRDTAWRRMLSAAPDDAALFRPALERWLQAAVSTDPQCLAPYLADPATQTACLHVCRALAVPTRSIAALACHSAAASSAAHDARAALCGQWLAHNLLTLDTLLAACPDPAAHIALCHAITQHWRHEPPRPAPLAATLAPQRPYPPEVAGAIAGVLAILVDPQIVAYALPLLRDDAATARAALAYWCRTEVPHA